MMTSARTEKPSFLCLEACFVKQSAKVQPNKRISVPGPDYLNDLQANTTPPFLPLRFFCKAIYLQAYFYNL
jgi:hypothetical protein